ncbi:MAG: class I SAM-dependent methyltransferase [Chloroflexi bacterium]|nr:class I SAM-dependent methyltransferase [Chloroflexota bacterium]
MPAVYLYGAPAASHRRLVWLGESPTAGYWDDHWAASTLCDAVRDARRHPILLEVFLHYSPPRGRVLEAGCGQGQWVVVLRERGRQVVGVDFATETLRSTSISRLFAPPPLASGDVRALPFADGTFDTYISLGVAEHFLYGPRALLAEARRVLRPGGHIVISVPYFSPLRQMRARLGGYAALSDGPLSAEQFYQFGFRVAEFAHLLEDEGFQVVERIPFSARWGLSEDLPLAARVHRAIAGRGARAQRDGSGARGASPTPARAADPAGHTPLASGARDGRATPLYALAKCVVDAFPVRWLAGHMVLFVGSRRP